jgi:GNAT superfamily N-acetyltransferase
MTTEEKAKAYDVALKKARKYRDEEGSTEMEDVFPELKESEDDRIRKELIEYLTHRAEVTGFIDEDKDCKRWISYLEKQKDSKVVKFDHDREQQPAEWSEEDKVMLNNIIYGVHMKSIKPLDEMDDRSKYEKYEDFLKSLPQRFNLQPKNEWSEDYREEDLRTRFAFYTYKNEEDDDVLYLSNVFVEETSRNKGFGTKILMAAEKVAETLGAIRICLKVKQDSPANAWYRKHGYGYIAFEGDYDWLEKTLEYMKPVKSEWSEEEIKVLDSIIDDYEKVAKSFCGYNRKIMLLKAIRDGEYDLSKQEWSEMDEKIWKTLLDYYEDALDNYACVEWLNGITYDELCTWLKFLKNRGNSPKNNTNSSWKPSEEQIGALERAIVKMHTPNDIDILAKLRDNLKKL